jgi:hypothetical protein
MEIRVTSPRIMFIMNSGDVALHRSQSENGVFIELFTVERENKGKGRKHYLINLKRYAPVIQRHAMEAGK